MAGDTEPRARPRLADMAAQTPADRERTVDAVRAASIVVVVLGHWLIASIFWDGGDPKWDNALAQVPGLWLATWVLQVMPMFFFVGGFSNFVSLEAVRRRGGGYAEFASGRLARLLRPTAIFCGVWLAMAVVLYVTGVRPSLVELLTKAVAQPLWFLGIYVGVVALAPPMLALHRRYGVRVVLALAGAGILVDAAYRLLDAKTVGYTNYLFVWLFVHQVGFLWGDGTLRRASRRTLWLMVAGGLGVLGVLTTSGAYPGSMVGLPGDRISNMTPPSVCILALTVWQAGFVMLARPAAERWLARRRPWTVVVAANSMIMTLFLWHLTAVVIVITVLFPLGFPQPETGTTGWWLLRPVWLVLLVVTLAPFAAVFGRWERPSGATRAPIGRRRGVPAAALAMIAVAVAILGFAVAGFAPRGSGKLVIVPFTPPAAAALLVAGALLMRVARRGVRPIAG